MRPLYAIATSAETGEYKSAIDYYYNKYMVKEKHMTEASSPEGYLKTAIEIIAYELTGKYRREWLIGDTLISKSCKLINEDKFRTNTFVLKILIDSLDAGKSYTMQETHKIIRRVFPTLEFGKRTSLSIVSDPNLMQRMKNQTKVSTYELDFSFDDVLKESKAEITEVDIF